MKLSRVGIVLAATFLVATPIIAFSATPLSAASSPSRLIVTFDSPVNDRSRASVQAAGANTIGELKLVNGLVVTVPDQAAAKRLQGLGGVKSVETDAVVRASAAPPKVTAPTPPQQLPWGVDRIDAEQAWLTSTTSTGTGVNVAVVDTGIDGGHADLKVNIKGGINFVSLQDQTKWADDNGHGTHVAGTIAALNNSAGVVGVAPNANLYAVKVLDRRGSGYTSTIISGIEWSITNKMNVINMSLGTPSNVLALQDAVDKAYNAGIVVVAAAGNSGDGNILTNNVEYPAKYASVIAVAATDNTDKRASFSSDGEEVEIAAPGVNIYSTTKGGGYGYMSGTSMASPHVAGVVAAMLATPIDTAADTNGDSKWNVDELRSYLHQTADDLGALGRDSFYGFGLVDGQEAVTGLAL